MTTWYEQLTASGQGWLLIVVGITIIAALIGAYWWDQRRGKDE